MSRIYAVANQKGGVGKTTTAINVAACLAEAGTPRAAGRLRSAGQRHERPGRAAQPRDAGRPTTCCTAPRSPTSSCRRAFPASIWRRRTPTWPRPRSSCRTASNRDAHPRRRARSGRRRLPVRHLLDCPPSLGLLTVNALAAANRLIVPVQCEYYALEGLAQLLETVELIRGALNPALALTGLLLTMYDGRTRLSGRRRARGAQRISAPRSSRPSCRAPCDSPRRRSHGLPISQYDPRLARRGCVLPGGARGGRAWIAPAATRARAGARARCSASRQARRTARCARCRSTDHSQPAPAARAHRRGALGGAVDSVRRDGVVQPMLVRGVGDAAGS